MKGHCHCMCISIERKYVRHTMEVSITILWSCGIGDVHIAIWERQTDRQIFSIQKLKRLPYSWVDVFMVPKNFNDIENIFCQTLQIRGHIEECSFETLDFLVYILLAYLVKYVVNIIRTTQLILHNSERVQKCLECT